MDSTPVESDPAFDEVELPLECSVNSLEGVIVCEDGTVVHEEEILGVQEDVIDEKLEEEHTERGALVECIADRYEWLRQPWNLTEKERWESQLWSHRRHQRESLESVESFWNRMPVCTRP